MTKNDDTACGKCGKTVPEDIAIGCDGFCNKWFDIQCAKINREEYDMINKLGKKIKWFCTVCTKQVTDIMKVKMVQNKDDWPSILNVVLDGIQGNSEVTANLAKRLQTIEDKENENSMTLKKLVQELGYIRKTFNINERTEIPSKPNYASKLTDQEVLSRTRPNSAVHIVKQKSESSEDYDISKGDLVGEDEQSHLNDEDDMRNEEELSSPSSTKYKKDQISWEKISRKKPNKQVGNPSQSLALKCDMSSSGQNPSSPLDNRSPLSFSQVLQKPTGRPSFLPKSEPQQTNQGKFRKESKEKNRPRVKQIVVGTGGDELCGVKRAWFHLGKLDKNTSTQNVENFLKDKFPQRDFVLERLDTKGFSSSFKVGVDFELKDKFLDTALWPKNVAVKRFLFYRRKAPQTG